MSTTTDESTLDVQPKARDISVLIDLGTYQGMTDEEIEKVIDFKATLKANNLRNTAVVNHVTEIGNQVVESHYDNMSTLFSMVEQVLDTHPVMQTIESEV